MLPDRVSNPGPLTYESGALPIALRGPAEGWGWGSGKNLMMLFYFLFFFFEKHSLHVHLINPPVSGYFLSPFIVTLDFNVVCHL